MNLQTLIALALEEDLGPGDVTSEACIPADAMGRARIVAKQDLVLSGQEAAAAMFEALGVRYERVSADGSALTPGDVVGMAAGTVRGILIAERHALNFLGRLSGIATWTHAHVQAAAGAFGVVDTRKTTPLHRFLEKAAVRHGGGRNHRFALYDGVLIKDNHIIAAGSVQQAIARAKASAHHLLRIQVEVESLEQAHEAVEAGADALLLDNMGDDLLARVIDALKGRVMLEASGNMDIPRITTLAAKGIHPDQVSVGGVIHQARWVDVSLDLEA